MRTSNAEAERRGQSISLRSAARSEIDNGGHSQFFYNSTGIVYADALAAFRELELSEGVAILKEAARKMGGEPSRDRTKRHAELDRFKPDFDDLDSRFYALDKRVDVDAVMTRYVRAHAPAFAFDGVVYMPDSAAQDRQRSVGGN